MAKIGNILLVLTLLVCPYVCLGQQSRSTCGNPTCQDSCESDLGDEAAAVDDCGCCHDSAKAQFGTVPLDHTPSTPKNPTQCLCEGATADTVGRSSEILPPSLLPAADPYLYEILQGRLILNGFNDSGTASRDQSGRDVCVTVCALLL